MRAGILGRRDDGRDALMAAALRPRAEALQAWRRWTSAGVDAGDDRVALRWLPLVARNLPAGSAERAAAQLRDAAFGAWAFNRRALTTASAVAAHLELAGIGVLLLKGAALEVRQASSFGGRAMGDVDLLVRPEAFEAARSLLEAVGWRAARGERRPIEPWRHSLDFGRSGEAAIDLHRFVFAECCWPDADDGVWQRAEAVASEDRVWRTPGPEDLLLHVCVHGLRWSPVHAGTWVADAAAILRRDGSRLDWARLIDDARRRSLTAQMRDALAVIARLTDAHIPADVPPALGRIRVPWVERIEERAKVRPVLGPSGLVANWSNWRRFGRRNGRRPGVLAYAASVAGLASARHLPSWAWRQFARRLAAGGRDPWALGRSTRPILPGRR